MSKSLQATVFVDENVSSVEQARFIATKAGEKQEQLKGKLRALVMATPRNICPDDDEPWHYVNGLFDDIWEELWDAFVDDYKYTVVADDAEYDENSLVQKAWDEENVALEELKKAGDRRRAFFDEHSEVLNPFNFDDIMLYEKWKDGEIMIPTPFTFEDRNRLIQEIKEKDNKLLEEALNNIKNGK